MDFVDKIKAPVGKTLLIRKAANGDQNENGDFAEGGVVLPDTVWDNTNFVEVIKVGLDCKLYTEDMIGQLTWCPEDCNSLNQAGCPESYHWVDEDGLIPLLFEDGLIKPMANMVVVEVKIMSGGNVVLTDYAARNYDPWGVVVGIGPKCRELNIGMEALVPAAAHTFMVGERRMMCIEESRIAAVRDAA
tara:strand:+ start:554 stop:1120 length:567 start_codon:yes stop_codon:yes gene_type:complete